MIAKSRCLDGTPCALAAVECRARMGMRVCARVGDPSGEGRRGIGENRCVGDSPLRPYDDHDGYDDYGGSVMRADGMRLRARVGNPSAMGVGAKHTAPKNGLRDDPSRRMLRPPPRNTVYWTVLASPPNAVCWMISTLTSRNIVPWMVSRSRGTTVRYRWIPGG